MAEELPDHGALELLDLYERRTASPVEVVDACLERIERDQPVSNAFVTVTAERARAAARDSERRWLAGEARALEGVPMALKDLVATAGVRTTGGSRVYGEWVPEADATVAVRLREAGAISVGKTAMTEFATAITGNTNFPPVRNPWDSSRTAGGSSSGSGVALAARQVALAVGTDTGGSVRIPAAYCGITGLKPTYGRVSRAGVMPLAWTLDHVGPMARSVADAAAMLAVMAGPDPEDSACSRRDPAGLNDFDGDVAGLRIGIPSGAPFDDCEPDVAAGVEYVARELERAGAQLVPIDLPHAHHAPVIAFTILCAEAASLHEELGERFHELTEQVVATLEHGATVSAVDYLRCQRLRRLVQEDFAASFQEVDAMLVPGNPIPAPGLEETLVTIGGRQHSALLTAVRMTSIFNLTGLPALAIPSGLSGGLPVGVQIVGRPFDERTCLRLGQAWQERSDIHRRIPESDPGAHGATA